MILIPPYDRAGLWFLGKGPPAIDFNFMSGPMPAEINFTRASSGAYLQPNGYLATAAANAPRLDSFPDGRPRGLLIEPSRTNLAGFSNDLTQWSRTNTSVLTNARNSVFGPLAAQKLVANAGVTAGYFYGERTVSVTSGQLVCGSIWAKAGGWDFYSIQAGGTQWTGPANNAAVRFNVNTGTYTTNTSFTGYAGMIYYPQTDEWYCWAVFPATATTTNATLLFMTSPTAGGAGNGDGVSGVFLAGGQIEIGSQPSSIIQTAGSASVTRAADKAVMESIPWWNPAGGTIIVEAQIPYQPGQLPCAVSFDDGTANNRIQIRRNNTADNWSTACVVAGVSSPMPNMGTTPGTDITRIALRCLPGDMAAAFNGTNLSKTAGPSVLPAVTRVAIGDGPALIPAGGWIRKVAYYNRPLGDAELVAASRLAA